MDREDRIEVEGDWERALPRFRRNPGLRRRRTSEPMRGRSAPSSRPSAPVPRDLDHIREGTIGLPEVAVDRDEAGETASLAGIGRHRAMNGVDQGSQARAYAESRTPRCTRREIAAARQQRENLAATAYQLRSRRWRTDSGQASRSDRSIAIDDRTIGFISARRSKPKREEQSRIEQRRLGRRLTQQQTVEHARLFDDPVAEKLVLRATAVRRQAGGSGALDRSPARVRPLRRTRQERGRVGGIADRIGPGSG